MRTSSLAALAFAASACALPSIAERETGCASNYDGTFEITVFRESGKRDLDSRSNLILTLKNGILKDDKGRTGYIASNHQFQFDAPPQKDAKQTSGFSVCSNGKLALGGNTEFFQCLSGNFNNLYNYSWAPQCKPIVIVAMGQGTGSSVSQVTDGQPQAKSTAGARPVSQMTDGQPQAPSKAPVTQIGDGQIQAPTGAPVTQIGDGQIQAPTSVAIAPPVTQITDGQVQAPTGAPVTQITDGQVQAPTGAPVTQITDGQVQAPTGAPVTQITDGQVQAPTSVGTIGVVPTTKPTTGPIAAGSQLIPATSVALFVAALGAVLYL